VPSDTDIVRRARAVLVLIDMQDRLADAMPRREAVVAASALLARVARTLEIPVMITRQYPAGLGDSVAELREVCADEEPVDKMTFDCLAEPSFRERLEGLNRRQVIIAGMEAHICVTQTALSLLAEGYLVHVVADAVCSRRDDDRNVALARLRAAGAVVTTTESVIYEALGVAGTPEFRTVLELVKAHPLGR
jgi:nicotinamidase-related amidase